MGYRHWASDVARHQPGALADRNPAGARRAGQPLGQLRVGLTTPGGYATWKYGLTILLIALWPLLTCARMIRGEESRGSLDVLLSLPRSRVRVALEKVGGVWTALLGMGVLIGLLVEAGGRSVNADFAVSEALLFG